MIVKFPSGISQICPLCLAYSIAPGIVLIASFVGVFVVKGMQQFLQPMLQGLQLWLVWILEPNFLLPLAQHLK